MAGAQSGADVGQSAGPQLGDGESFPVAGRTDTPAGDIAGSAEGIDSARGQFGELPLPDAHHLRIAHEWPPQLRLGASIWAAPLTASTWSSWPPSGKFSSSARKSGTQGPRTSVTSPPSA